MCGSSKTTQNTATSTTLPAWATAAGQTDYTNAANTLAANPWQGYSGPTTASFGPQTGTASDFLTGTLGQPNQNTTNAGNAVSSVLGNINPAETTSQLMNPYVAATLAPTLENLGITQQQQTANLGGQAAMSGAFGDSTQGVQQSLLDNFNQQNVANATGQAYSGAYNAAQQQQNAQMGEILSGANTQATLGTQQNSQNDVVSQLLASLGAQQQTAGQTGITNAIQLNTQNQTMPLSQQATLAQILGMSPMDTSGTGSSVTSQPDNSGYALLGSLLSAI